MFDLSSLNSSSSVLSANLRVGESKFTYLARIALVAVIPVTVAVTLAVLLGWYRPVAESLLPNWRLGSVHATLAMGFLDVLLLSPLVETGLLLVPIRILRWCRVSEHLLPYLAAIPWGAVHAHNHGGLMGLVALWPFFWFTVVLLKFEKPSLDRAWVYASSVHAIHNVFALAVSFILAR